MSVLKRAVRGIRDSLPSGYVLGRQSSGSGPAELISTASLGQNIISAGYGGVQSLAAGTDISITGTNGNLTVGYSGSSGGAAYGTYGPICSAYSSAAFCAKGAILYPTQALVLAGVSATLNAVAAQTYYAIVSTPTGLDIGTIVATSSVVTIATTAAAIVPFSFSTFPITLAANGKYLVLIVLSSGTGTTPIPLGTNGNITYSNLYAGLPMNPLLMNTSGVGAACGVNPPVAGSGWQTESDYYGVNLTFMFPTSA